MKRLVSLFLVIALAGSLAVSAALGDSMYIIPDSDTRKLTEEELWEWDYESLGYILNEIYARHGYDFGAGEKYENYFSTLPWYTPNESDDNNQACYGQLNSTEWYNEALIKRGLKRRNFDRHEYFVLFKVDGDKAKVTNIFHFRENSIAKLK